MADLAPVNLMHTALAAHDAGLCIIPIRGDGSKKPALSWKQYQTARPDRDEVRAWFAPGRHTAAAVVCGQVSGWLVMIEMEGWAFDAGHWQTFRSDVVAVLGEDRWAEITRYVERSPSGGVHVYVRCPGYDIGNVKLAMMTNPDTGAREVAMETRGQGGYSVIAGSVGHATGAGWEVATTGTLEDIVTVTDAELDTVLAAAGGLHEEAQALGEVGGEPSSLKPDAGADLPEHSSSEHHHWMDDTIADFNETVDALAWLPDWHAAGDDTANGEHVVRLHRDGSDNDHGAVLFDSGRVGFFSSNCPAWAEPYDGRSMRTYDPFTVMMHVEKGGNSKELRVAVARELRAQGFGPQPEQAISASDETPDAPDTGEIEPEKPILALRWVEDALADMPPEPEAIVTNLLRRGEITVLGAPRAIGKTWASLNLATILARGEGELFGTDKFTPAGPRRVLYLQGELGEWGSATRWEMTCAGNLERTWPQGMVAETFERVRIRTTHRKVTEMVDGQVWEDTHTDAIVDHRLEPAIEAGGFDVLIVDPWATFFAGAENSNDETEAAILALTDIARRQNIAVWIVHHISAKTQHSSLAEPEDLWRGASRLADAVATRLTVLPHYSPADAKKLGLDRTQARRYIDVHVLERNGPPVGMIHAQREGVWWTAWAPASMPSPDTGRPAEVTPKQVMDALARCKGAQVSSQTELADLLGVHRRAATRVIGELVQLGMVETIQGARGAVGYRAIEGA